MGAPLLERTTRRVTLTPLGRELVPLVRRMLEDFDTSLFSMRDLGGRRAGQITLACIPTATFYFLPSVIARFTEEYPNIRFRILDLSENERLESVAFGNADSGLNLVGTSEPGLTFEPLLGDSFVLACRRDHALAQRDRIEWADLKGSGSSW